MGDPSTFIFWTGSEKDDWPFPDPVRFIREELKQGRLRQGWAPPGASLVDNDVTVPQRVWEQRYAKSVIENWKAERNSPLLDPRAKITTRYRILSGMLRMDKGDVILVPRMPSPNEFTVVRVSDRYRYDDSHYARLHSDLGHIVPIDPASLATYGYNFSDATRRISGMFQHYRSAISSVRKPEFRRLILDLAER